MSVNDLTNLIKNAKSIAVLNALPLNAFTKPISLQIWPITAPDKVLTLVATLSSHSNVKCFIGHQPTAAVLGLKNCTRAMWTYNNEDLIIAAVLKTRPAAPGAGDVNVTLGDLLFYIIVPTPLT